MSIILVLILFIVCELCKCKHTAKKGFRYNRIGKKQKYYCHGCKSWFIEDDGFKRMRFRPKIITRAIHQYEDGLSLSKVQNHLNQHDNTKVTRWTILKWVKRYSDLFKKNSSQISSLKSKA